MPEFILQIDDYRAWAKLDPFTQGYIEALFFTNTTSSVSSHQWDDPEIQEDLAQGRLDGPIPNDVGFNDLDPDNLRKIINLCTTWQKTNAELLEQVYSRHIFDYNETMAGRDLWYTSQGHGVGFWDRDLGELGDKLTAACRGMHEPLITYENGVLYVE